MTENDNIDEYLLIDKIQNNKGENMMELKECEGKLIIKQYSGINTDNFVIKKLDGKKISFSFFKINGIFYVNINGEHIIDYKKFVNIQQVSKQENNIQVKNTFIGDIIIYNCDVEIFSKSLSIMNKFMKNKKNYYSDFAYFLFN
jgi:hypothetical protein